MRSRLSNFFAAAMLIAVPVFVSSSCQAHTLASQMKQDGSVTATYGALPLITNLRVEHAGVRAGALQAQVTPRDGRPVAIAGGAGNAGAQWWTEVQGNELQLHVRFNADKNADGTFPAMNSTVTFAPDVFKDRRYELWNEVAHPGGPVATLSSTGNFAPAAGQPFDFTPVKYGTVRAARFYGKDNVIEVRMQPSSVSVSEDGSWQARTLAAPGDLVYSVRVREYSDLLNELVGAPGVTEQDAATPPGPNLFSLNGGFEEPFAKPFKAGDQASFSWGLSLADGAEATIEPSTLDAHSGVRSLRIVKRNNPGYIQIYQPWGDNPTPRVPGFHKAPATKDGTRFLMRYWGRVRNTATLKGGVYIYREGSDAATIPHGSALAFTMKTGNTDITPWMPMTHIFTLKKGEYINGLMFTITGSQGDEAWIDDIALYQVPDDYKMLEPLQILQAAWPVVPPEIAQLLPTSMRTPATPGNLLQNSSFEAGADRMGRWGWREDQKFRIDRTVAWHGVSSLLLENDVAPVTNSYRIEPGKLHTFSFYAKADEPGRLLHVECLSGLSAVYSGDDWRSRLGVRRTFALSPEWRRYSVSFIPTTRILPTMNVHFSKQESRAGRIWVDAMQLEQGTPTDFKLEAGLQVSAGLNAPDPGDMDVTPFAGWIEHMPKALPPGENLMRAKPRTTVFAPEDAIPFKASVYSEKPTDVDLTWQFIDYYGRVARTEKRSLKVGAERVAEDRFTLTGFDHGRYVMRVSAVSPGAANVKAEETSFIVLPKVLDDPGFQTDFGFHAWEPSWVLWHRRLGFHSLRTLDGVMTWSIAWRFTEPERGKYRFQDDTYNWLKSHGIDTYICLDPNVDGHLMNTGVRRTPDWARVDADKYPKGSPEYSFGFDSQAYLKYVEALVTFWKGRIKTYEIWNEPYGQRESAQATGELGRKIAAIIKRIDPAAKIHAPSTYWGSGNVEWTRNTMQHFKTDQLDGFSYHGYPTRLHEETNWSWTQGLSTFNQIMAENGGVRPMIETEFQASKSWLWSDRFNGTGNLTYLPSPTENDGDVFQTRVASQYYLIARAVGTNFFYTYQAWEPGYGTHDDLTPGNGLVSTAVNGWLMGGAKFVQQVELGEKVRCYIFETRDKRLMAGMFGMYLDNPAKIRFPLTPQGTEVYGVIGTKLWPHRDAEPLAREANGGLELTLTRDPMYILAPAGMNRAQFVQAVSGASLSGVQTAAAQPFVINDHGQPAVAIAVNNLSPSGTLSATAKIEAQTGSAWRLEKSEITGDVPAKEERVLLLPLAALPTKASTPATIKTSISTQTGGTPIEKSVRVMGISKAPAGLRVDGNVDDWNTVPVGIAIDNKEQIADEKSGTSWDGPADSSMKMKLAWDTQNLYFAAEVFDNKFVMDRPAKVNPLAYWYASDSLELFLDTSNVASLSRRNTPTDKQHLIFIAGRGGDKTADWSALSGADALKDIRVASSFTANGYVIEGAIPLASFPAVKEDKPGTVLRLFAALNDRDEPGDTHSRRKTGMLWYSISDWSTDSLDYTSAVFLP